MPHTPSTSVKSGVGSFLVLEHPQNIKRKGRILGSVVPSNSCASPFDGYAPYWDDPKWATNPEDLRVLKETIDFLWKPQNGTESEGVKLIDVIASRGGGNKTEAQVKVTQALEGYANRTINEDIRIEAGNVEEYTIDNPFKAVSSRLSKCKPWIEEVQSLCQDDPRPKPVFYLVTGIYTCKNMVVGWSKGSSDEKRFAAHVPLEAAIPAAQGAAPLAVGAAKALQTSAKYQWGKETNAEVSTKIEEEIIFALRYHELIIKYDESAKYPGFFSKLGQLFGGEPDMDAVRASRVIKSVSLGDAVRDVGWLTSYGQGDIADLLYWEEPIYKMPHLANSNGSTH